MPSVGPRCHELRVTDKGQSWRIVYVAMKLALARKLRERRRRRHLSQTQLAKVLGSSQSRVAKMEAGDPTVSADLLIKSLLTLGSTRRELATAIGRLKVKSVA